MKSIALLSLVLAGCSSTPPEQRQNASAVIACRDFATTISDVSKGLLTELELRQRVQAIYENARLASVDSYSKKPPFGFHQSAETMLRSVTNTPDPEAFGAAAKQFTEACNQPL